MGADERMGLLRTVALHAAVLPLLPFALVAIHGVHTLSRLADDGLCKDLVELGSERLASTRVTNDEDCVVQAEDDSDPVALFFEAIKEYCHNLDVKYYPKIKPYIVQRHENSISVRWKEQTLEEGYELVVFELTQVDRVITLKKEGGES